MRSPLFPSVMLTLVALVGCAYATPKTDGALVPVPTLYPSPHAAQATPLPQTVMTNTSDAVTTRTRYDGVWHAAKPGIDVMLAEREVNGKREWLLIARADPQRVMLRTLYSPDGPMSAREWQAETQADLVINGGFFDDANRVTGLLIADGQPFGKTYRGFGGMFAWSGAGPSLRWLRDQPYRPDASIQQAVQGFPMLVVSGTRIDQITDNGEQNRRSFVALDGEGHLLFGVTQMAQWTLTDLADFLDRAADLNIVSAMNLDGGASSGLWMSGGQQDVSMNSFDAVPAVIAVWSR